MAGRNDTMKISQARRLYIVSAQTVTRLKEKICSRCGLGFFLGQPVLSKDMNANSKYGVYHKKCASEVHLI